jgi:hypothetical protein
MLENLISELARPKNQSLLEFVLPRLTSAEDVRRLLQSIKNPEQLQSVFKGHAGELAEKILREDCGRLFEAAVADLLGLKVQFEISTTANNRVTGWPKIQNHRAWWEYEEALCVVISKNLHEPFLCDRFLDLLELTEWSLRQATDRTAKELGLRPRSAWGEVARVYGCLDGGSFAIPLQRMLSALREHHRFPNNGDIPNRLYLKLRERVRRDPCPDLALLCLFGFLQYRHPDIDFRIELLSKAITSGTSIVQSRAVEMIEFSASHVMTHCLEKKTEIVSLLERLLPDDGEFDMKGVMDALCAFDAVETPVSVDEAIQEVEEIFRGAEEAPVEVERFLAADGYTLQQYAAERANSWLGRILEPVFQGVYSEAYQLLDDSQKSRLLCLAAQTPNIGWSTSWILEEMLLLGRIPEAGPVYERFGSTVQKKGFSSQDAVQAFVLGIQGRATVSDKPCEYRGEDTAEHRAWDLVGQMLFWLFKLRREEASAKIEKLWERACVEAPLALADVLYRLRSAASMRYGNQTAQTVHEVLLNAAPSASLRVLELSLTSRGRLTSLFPFWRGNQDTDLVLFVVEALGRFGNSSTVNLLKSVVDDPQLGSAALAALKRIRESQRQPSESQKF